MKVTLLGTGDSAGIPQIGCRCETCERHSREGRHRTRFSVLIENEGTGEDVLIDASPDLRFQFLREGIDSVDNIVLTHGHYDHYAGLGSLYRVTWSDLPIYGVDNVLEYVVEERYSYLPFPEPVAVEPFETFEAAGYEFELVPVHHPPAEAYGVVVRGDGVKVAVTGDTSRYFGERSTEAFRDADLLVADAFIPADGDYGGFIDDRISDDGYDFADKHMTYEGALDLVDELEPDDSAFVHLSHYYREEHDELGRDGDTFVL
ncbi:MAG: MBL fold metallo-hydrolase [Halobacteria archaeon]|nr:MBL fold metallo-hydrolase [Halobacteria archaeon]